MNLSWKVVGVIVAAALLVGAGAYAASTSHTTGVVKFNHNVGCLVLDSTGKTLGNVTITYFNVAAIPGSAIVISYSVGNFSNRTQTLQTVDVATDAALVGVVSGATFPVVLASGSTTPFVLTLTVQQAVVSQTTDSTFTVSANCA